MNQTTDLATPLPAYADQPDLKPSSLPFPVVGIGASAGGLAALRTFFENMPAQTGMAFVVVLHLSPQHESGLAELLQAVTKMPVTQVRDATPVEADHVYVIPPTKDLSMDDGRMRLSETQRPRGRHVVIDLFFRTLAHVHRERAVAVVLSGTGADGSVGIARVKEQGGVTLVQSPDDAEFDGMPRAALDTGMVDWTMPVADLPLKLVDLWANARAIELPPGIDAAAQTDTTEAGEATRRAEKALHDILALLRVRTGHDFRHYKRATVLRRLERRLQVRSVRDLPSYRDVLVGDPPEAQALLRDLLISVTNFFRDRDAFEAIERDVLPSIFQAAGDGQPVRAWVAGCATGEEAYSLAMLLGEQAEQAAETPEVQVFATDIDEAAIAVARTGAYPGSIVTDVPPTRLRQHFIADGARYRVRKEVRERVMFASHNVLRDPPFSRLDLISCRNLLIYLDRDVQEDILQTFHFALRPGGYLFLGSSESADSVAGLFTPVDKKHRIFRANAVARSPRLLPVVPGDALRRLAGPSPAERAEPARPSYAEAHRQLLEQHMPASVLADAEGNIVHLSRHAGRFLLHAAGAPSNNLLTLALPELRLELRAALRQALQAGKSVEARPVRLQRDGAAFFVNMIVRPVAPSALGPMVMVVFVEIDDTTSTDERANAGDTGKDPVVRQLEAELHRTSEQLQLSVEQAETSNEELKASDEELQAINEELRSASEELETSKEELQSINEELTTVNQELKTKVEEADKINDDLQNLVASTDIASVFVDRAMTIKRYTPRARQVFNIRPSDVGRSLLDLTHRLKADTLGDDAAEAFRSLRTIERETASSDERWYLVRTTPYRTTEDRIDGAVLNFIDVTERKHVEQRLDAEERHMRMVADSMRDYAIVTFSVDGLIVTWNAGAERTFGYTEAQAVGQPTALIFTPEDRAIGRPDEEMRQAREEGRAEDDRWHLRIDGRRVYCSGIMTPLLEDDGTLRGYAKIARDLTGAKRSENEREALLRTEAAGRAEAIAASQLKDEFLAVMSHELKNPLNLIHLNAELLARLPEAQALPSVERAAEVIQKTTLSLAQIIDDLFDLSRMRTGKLSLTTQAVDWGAVVGSIVGALAGDARERRIELVVERPEAPVTVEADPVRVEQIVWNLLSNALKFTPEDGRVTVRLAADGACGVLEVQDTGRGIDPKHLPRLFGMFQQAASPTARREGGLGIGLALARQLAQAQGGELEGASPGLGLGSTFTVRLPLVSRAADDAVPGAAAAALPGGLRVLIVDDDPEHVRMLGELLRLEGADVASASSAAEALTLAGQRVFDAIISDIAMPGADGYSLVRALKQSPRTHAVPVVAVTGFGRAGDAARAIEAGFDAHLGKPLTIDGLTATLLRVLREAAVR